MPSYLRGKKRPNIKFVHPHAGVLLYGFKPKDYTGVVGISAADLTPLGWIDAAAIPAGSITILGANAPKPQRMKFKMNSNPSASVQGSASTYCDYGSIKNAIAAKWEPIGSTRGIRLSNNLRTKTVGAKIDVSGALYLFPMNAADAGSFATELGLQQPETINAADRAKAFSGTSRPRPAKVGKVVDNTTGATFSSYCSYDALDTALTAGYQIIASEVLPPVPYSTTPTPP